MIINQFNKKELEFIIVIKFIMLLKHLSTQAFLSGFIFEPFLMLRKYTFVNLFEQPLNLNCID
jgi:hypothetical protein